MVEVLPTPAAAELRVQEQHVRNGHLDHDLPGAGDRVWRLTDRQHLRATNRVSQTTRILFPHSLSDGCRSWRACPPARGKPAFKTRMGWLWGVRSGWFEPDAG
jgi:hypothetical protein